MDPQATWDALLDSWEQADWNEVFELAEALLAWMRKGGFPPNTTRSRQLGVEWNLATTVAACQFAFQRASSVLNSPHRIPVEVPFTLSCDSCGNEGPDVFDDALAEGWSQIRHTPVGESYNFLGCCPICDSSDL